MNAEMLRRLEQRVLPHISQPAQYIGGEYNQIAKPLDDPRIAVRWALAFPDSYSVGMSHLGLKIIYEILNRRDDTAAERVFAPFPDLEAALRREQLPLYSLETKTALSRFDVLAFSLMQELCYTNVLTMIDLAGLPLLAADRDTQFGAQPIGVGSPLICGGGHCAHCSEPIAEFFDFFVNGDAEDVVVEINDVLIDAKKQGITRRQTLERLARDVSGIYVPAFYSVEYGADGRVSAVKLNAAGVAAGAPALVARRAVKDFEHSVIPVRPVVAWIETVHDRYAVEIMRGCVNGCRFCQAGMITRPRRCRSVETIIDAAETAINNTGYDEVGLLSLSSSDYPGIAALSSELNRRLSPKGVNISLPSLRVRTVVGELTDQSESVRKSGLTLAPEAAGERLRRIINKPIDDEELFDGVREAYRQGYNRVKLYFMIGLPGETDEDVRAIAHLSETIAFLRKDVRSGGPANISVSVGNFVPKPGTPFQYAPQASIDELRRKRRLVLDENVSRAVRFSFHDPATSWLEAVFARGDRRLSAAVINAWNAGARFDAWEEYADVSRWRTAFAETGINADSIACAELPVDSMLPSSHLSPGVSESFLRREYARAMAEIPLPTPSCETIDGKGTCSNCGSC